MRILKTKKLYILLLLLLVGAGLRAQTFTLQGRVTDKDGSPVELASVSVVSQGKMVMTNMQGRYHMTLQSADSVVVRFSMVGYKAKERVLRHPRGTQTLQVQLYDDNSLDEVVVTAEEARQQGMNQRLDTKNLKTAPSVGGNAVEELIQSQAGVSTHSELSSQYNVRGGAFDENSVYINNVEIFRPFLVRSGQQEGLSVINPDMVKEIQFSTGGFDAKYGDKMSSALDITYKTLKPKQGKKSYAEGSAQASLLGAGVYLGVATKKLSWLNSLRYKTNRYLLGSLQTTGEYNPNFLDYQTYLNYRPNQKWTVDFIGNISDNHYNFKPKDRDTNFGTLENVKNFRVYFDGQEKDRFLTYFGSLGLTRHLTAKTNVSLIASAFKTKEQEKYDIQGQYWLTQTETSENLGVGTYMDHARNYLDASVVSLKLMLKHRTAHHNVEGGLTYKWENIKENSREYEYRDSSGYSIPHTGNDLYMIYALRAINKINARRTEVYLQDSWHWTAQDDSTHFTLNYGARFSNWSFNSESIFSPRVSLSVTPRFNNDMTFRLATGLYYQAPFFKELRDTTTQNGITTAGLNKNIRSQRSIQFIAGWDYRFRLVGKKYRFSAEAYYKMLQNFIPYSVNNVKVVYYGDQKCSGHATGLDLKLYGEFVPGTDSWISLSLMNTRMKLNGKSIPLPTDQRYAINLFFTDYFPGTTRWKMSLKLAYADGLPFSAPHRELENNTFRAPAYKRADIGMQWRAINNEDRHMRSFVKNLWLGIDCLNLFGINNVNSYYWITDVTGQQYAVPNYLTGRQINGRVLLEF